MVYVGKAAGFHTRTQAEIHALLQARLFRLPFPKSHPHAPRRPQEFAAAGACVLRLKGGDPLVFGRGGEEAAHLRAAGIPVSVTPGVTAAAGIAAELGIPLTHRGVATSVRFLTGHLRSGAESDGLESVEEATRGATGADGATTLVLYMGLAALPALAAALQAQGLAGATPAVAVERGTTPQQRRVFAPLQGLVAGVRAAGLVSPTLVVVGDVVALSPLWPWAQGECLSGDEWRLQLGRPHSDAHWLALPEDSLSAQLAVACRE